jgi:hypothetical protein
VIRSAAAKPEVPEATLAVLQAAAQPTAPMSRLDQIRAFGNLHLAKREADKLASGSTEEDERPGAGIGPQLGAILAGSARRAAGGADEVDDAFLLRALA